MRVSRVETFLVPPRWLFCRIETDHGLVGWGEPIVEGRAETTRAAVHELAELLLGTDPRLVEDSWQVMTRGGFYRNGPILSSAVAGLDQALWDIAGKSAGLPVFAMLGGAVRDSIRVYSWVGGDDPLDREEEQLEEEVRQRMDAGFSAIKTNLVGAVGAPTSRATLDRSVERIYRLRETFPTLDIAVDFHGRVSISDAIQLIARLEDAGLMFIEEPTRPEHVFRIERITSSTTIPIAVGERLYSRWDFRPVLEAGVAVVQPDLSHSGGISEVRRIADLAELYGASLAPHCPLGPISLAASLQICFGASNAMIQEQSLGLHYGAGSDLLAYVSDTTPFEVENGSFVRLDRPGLGVDIDEEVVREADRNGHRWRNPVMRQQDGSFAEW